MTLIRRRAFRALMVALIVGCSAGMLGMSKSGGGSGGTSGTSGSGSSGPAAAIPEPTGFVVFAIGAGLVGLAVNRRSRKS